MLMVYHRGRRSRRLESRTDVSRLRQLGLGVVKLIGYLVCLLVSDRGNACSSYIWVLFGLGKLIRDKTLLDAWAYGA